MSNAKRIGSTIRRPSGFVGSRSRFALRDGIDDYDYRSYDDRDYGTPAN